MPLATRPAQPSPPASQCNALFIYLLERRIIRGLVRYIYWLVVSIGVVLNIYRLYKVCAEEFPPPRRRVSRPSSLAAVVRFLP